MYNAIFQSPRNSKRVFVRQIITSVIVLIAIFPMHFINDNQKLGMNCLAWLILVCIFLLCDIGIYLQRRW